MSSLRVAIALALALPAGCAQRAAQGQAVAEPDRIEALAPSPTATWQSLRDQIEARMSPAGPDLCRSWANQLMALHDEHGEPFVGARLEAATVLHDCGRDDGARAVLKDKLEQMPRWARAEALNTLAVIAHERGEFGEAVAYLFEALAADPGLVEARDNLVRMMIRRYAETGSQLAYEEAEQRMSEWIRLTPEDPRPHLHRARLLVVRGRTSPESMVEAEVVLSELLRRPLAAEIEARVHAVRAEIHAAREAHVQALESALVAIAPPSGCPSPALGLLQWGPPSGCPSPALGLLQWPALGLPVAISGLPSRLY